MESRGVPLAFPAESLREDFALVLGGGGGVLFLESSLRLTAVKNNVHGGKTSLWDISAFSQELGTQDGVDRGRFLSTRSPRINIKIWKGLLVSESHPGR